MLEMASILLGRRISKNSFFKGKKTSSMLLSSHRKKESSMSRKMNHHSSELLIVKQKRSYKTKTYMLEDNKQIPIAYKIDMLYD